ncbi:hypothetical protein BS47DRAFT_1337898 [Hydnum rufescens UP504]|uniref:Uncharacterized protein n=1 Tax=Hydnum rufescens UP504 TaxID=1448309 RepID=A0A9P6DXS0_9AGAM|nr:hypothetical protein BS47DRAFT_1337898 [Hydnum rufescens UP504]
MSSHATGGGKSTKMDDPRDPGLEVGSTVPPSWKKQSLDPFGSSSMMLGGLTMVTRNPVVAWTTIFIGLWGWLNSHPLRTKDGGTAGQGIIYAVGALIAAYVPRLIITQSAPAS